MLSWSYRGQRSRLGASVEVSRILSWPIVADDEEEKPVFFCVVKVSLKGYSTAEINKTGMRGFHLTSRFVCILLVELRTIKLLA